MRKFLWVAGAILVVLYTVKASLPSSAQSTVPAEQATSSAAQTTASAVQTTADAEFPSQDLDGSAEVSGRSGEGDEKISRQSSRIRDAIDGKGLEVLPFATPVLLDGGSKKRKKLAEISGLTHSPIRSDLLWAIADGGEGRLFGIHYLVQAEEIERIQEFQVDDPKAFDWEALASFEHGGEGFLLIADTGANTNPPPRYLRLLIVPEPLPEMAQKMGGIPVLWEGRIRTQELEDSKEFKEANDIEAVAVDSQRWEILLIRKRKKDQQVAVVDLPEGFPKDKSRQVVDLPSIAELPWSDLRLPAPKPDEAGRPGFQYRFRTSPTGLDLHSVGPTARAVLLTYRHAYLFSRGSNQPWSEALQQDPRQIPLPFRFKGDDYPRGVSAQLILPQREAVAFDSSGNHLFVASEASSEVGWRLLYLAEQSP